MKFEKTYRIDQWTEWNKSFAESMQDFFDSFNFQANILETNDYLYSQIDFLINIIPNEKEHIKGRDELLGKVKPPNINEFIKINSFQYKENSLDFAVDNNLDDKEFRLIYDSNPDWKNDDLIDDSPVPEFEKIKIYQRGQQKQK